MQELITITEHNGNKAVSARELHNFVEATERFANWCNRMFEYDFEEYTDYTPLTFLHPQNKQRLQDYALTLDCAKEISMLQRNDKGKQARKYFIEVEKRAKALVKPPSTLELLKQAVSEIERKDEELRLQRNANKRIAPKAEYFDEVLQSNSTYNTTQIAKELGMAANSLNKILHEKKVQYKVNKTWVLYQAYQNKEYTKTKTYNYLDNGEQKTSMQTVWTEKGRLFIHSLINPMLKAG